MELVLRGVYSFDKIKRFQLVITEVCVSGIAIFTLVLSCPNPNLPLNVQNPSVR